MGQRDDETRRIRLVAVAGARPNFMKIAPLLRELEARGGFEVFLVHTGQHYDAVMSDGFFEDLGIRTPDRNLGVGSGTHAQMTAAVLEKMEPILVDQAPAALVVVGDVNSTLAASLAASKLGIPIAHVEAGLRSFDRAMPEEINRILTDSISDWLFVTEPAGEENLQREGADPSRVHRVGNVMIDTLVRHLARAREMDTLKRLGLTPGRYVALTLHRPSNVDDPGHLRRLFDVFEEIHRELPVVFPVHPRTPHRHRGATGRRHPGNSHDGSARISRFPAPDGRCKLRTDRLRRRAGGDHRAGRALPHHAREHRTADHGHGGHQPASSAATRK